MRKPTPPLKLILPITAALDMSFQLLAFFILTFRPMPVEGQLAHVQTPPVPHPVGDPIGIDDVRRDEYTISVVAAANGEIAALSMRGPTRNTGELKTYDALLRELKAIPKPPGDGASGVGITIESSNDLQYKRLVDLLDVCKRAGYGSVNLTPMRPGPSM